MTREEAISKLNELIECTVDRNMIDDICYEIIEFLEAQEPRVIVANELEDWVDPVYLEDIFYGGRWALIADFSANWFTFKVTEPGFLKDEEFHYSEYGRRWRCWTSRPTDAQREAVKWE